VEGFRLVVNTKGNKKGVRQKPIWEPIVKFLYLPMIIQYHKIEKVGAEELPIGLIHGHELKMGKT
jgi:hypothetical protein